MCVYSTVGLSVDPPPTEKSKYVDGPDGIESFILLRSFGSNIDHVGQSTSFRTFFKSKVLMDRKKDVLENQSKHLIQISR